MQQQQEEVVPTAGSGYDEKIGEIKCETDLLEPRMCGFTATVLVILHLNDILRRDGLQLVQ